MESAQAAPLTVDDLLQLDTNDRRFEVVNGEIVEISPVGILHGLIAGTAYTDDGVLTAETLFPGLALRIGDLFALPEMED